MKQALKLSIIQKGLQPRIRIQQLKMQLCISLKRFRNLSSTVIKIRSSIVASNTFHGSIIKQRILRCRISMHLTLYNAYVAQTINSKKQMQIVCILEYNNASIKMMISFGIGFSFSIHCGRALRTITNTRNANDDTTIVY